MTNDADKPATPAVLNIDAFIALDTVKHNVRRETTPGNLIETGWIWELADSSHAQAVKYRADRKRERDARAASLNAKILNNKKVKPEDTDVSETEREEMEGFASRVVGFETITFTRPELADLPSPLTYSPANAVKVFMHPKLKWVWLDIARRLNDDSAFLPTSANS